MVQAIINVNEHTNRVLNIIKAKYALKDKSQAIEKIAQEYEETILEPKLRPEYVEKLNTIKKQKAVGFKTMDELRKHIDNA